MEHVSGLSGEKQVLFPLYAIIFPNQHKTL